MDSIFSFGQWVREWRQVLRLRQTEVAHRVGCSVVLVRKIEADERQPSVEVAQRLARTLHLAPHEWPAFVRSARAQMTVDRLPSPHHGIQTSQLEPAPFLVPALPIQPIGRKAWVGEIQALLGQTRLLSLCGPPGVGKTTLALLTAPELKAQYRDGIAFVSLASVQDVGMLPAAIMRVLDVPEERGRSAEQVLLQACQNKQLLLILDNFEHLLEAAGLIAQLLAYAARLQILITSRSPLRLRGEYLLSVESLLSDDAVALFVERARALQHDFVIDDSNRSTITAIVERLDRVPLAIELAAASIPVCSPQLLLQRLTQSSLRELRSNLRDLPKRHQSLFDAIAWSYKLLGAQEQLLFRFLGVFLGGCSVEAILEIASNLNADELLKKLWILADQNLIMLRSGRCHVLETLRAFALDQLNVLNEIEQARRRHSQYYYRLALQAQVLASTARHIEWLEMITQDADNVCAALQWFFDTDQFDDLGQMASALLSFWIRRHRMAEGQAWFKQALVSSDISAATRIKLCSAYARIDMEFGDLHSAEHYFVQALDLSHGLADELQTAALMAEVGQVRVWLGYPRAESEPILNESLAIFRRLDNPRGCALALSGLGWLENLAAHYNEAIFLHQEALQLRRTAGESQEAIAASLGNLAVVAENTGDILALVAYHQARLECHKAMGDKLGTMVVSRQLGYANALLGQQEQAFVLFREGLELCRSMNNIQQTTLMLSAMTHTALEAGIWDDASYYAYESYLVAGSVDDWVSQLRASYNRAIAALACQEYPIAEQQFQVLLKQAEMHDDMKHCCRALQGLGMLARRRHKLELAQRYLEQSLELSQRHSVPSWSGRTHTELGLLALSKRQREEASSHALQAVQLMHRSIRVYLCIAALEAVAAVELEHKPEYAVMLLSVAASDRKQRQNPLWPADQKEHAAWLAHAQDVLGHEAFDIAWEAGKRLGRQQAVRELLEERSCRPSSW